MTFKSPTRTYPSLVFIAVVCCFSLQLVEGLLHREERNNPSVPQDTETDACNSNPCTRGVCYHYQTQFHCVCPPGYTGKTCEINNNECISQPCLNGGSCHDGVENFSCTCASGFTGNLCETDIDECPHFNPCMNGGECIDGINRFTCRCKTGYDGKLCQNETDPCEYNPCVRGTCFSHLSQFFCECPKGFTGKLCENSILLTLNGPSEVNVKVQIGAELLMNCSVLSSNQSATVYRWTKVGGCEWTRYGYNGSVYLERDANVGDSGTYICTATYQQEPPVQKFFHVEVMWQSEFCDFDDRDLCRWRPDWYWYLQDGNQSPFTGIQQYNDHTTGTENGMYLQIPASTQRDSDEIANITSHFLPANHTICLEFWYRISGKGVGKLSMFLKDTCLTKQTELTAFIGDHGQKWNKAAATIPKDYIPNDYYIIIQAYISRSFHGDIAVDDFLYSEGNCQGDQGVSIVG